MKKVIATKKKKPVVTAIKKKQPKPSRRGYSQYASKGGKKKA